ncbi:unnamed protein product, partial [Prorocentrum cordatum]
MTWSEVEFVPALHGPVCEASMAVVGGKLYFSNPTSRKSRGLLGIRRSEDGGRTWSGAFVLQHERSGGYSSIVAGPLGGGALGGILYEAAAEGSIDFITFPLSLEGPDHSEDSAQPPDYFRVARSAMLFLYGRGGFVAVSSLRALRRSCAEAREAHRMGELPELAVELFASGGGLPTEFVRAPARAFS